MRIASCSKSAIALAAALAAASAVQAAPLTSVTISGTAQGYCASGSVVTACPATASLVTDNAAAGNIELGQLGDAAKVGTIAGMAGTHSVVLSSLTQADWTISLATAYITAAANSVGLGAGLALPSVSGTPGKTRLNDALDGFFALQSWKRLSDPNVEFVEFTSNVLSIGLAGVLDARPLFTNLFGAQVVGQIPTAATVQASEVIKLTFDDKTQYLYSFRGTGTGLGTSTESYSASFVVTAAIAEVPEPGSLALLGLGLAGMAAAARRRSTKS